MRRRHGLFLDEVNRSPVTPGMSCVVILAESSDLAGLVIGAAHGAGWRGVVPLADEAVARSLVLHRPAVVVVEDGLALGADLVRRVRLAGFGGRMVVVAGAGGAGRSGCLDAGADAYVASPATTARILEALELSVAPGASAEGLRADAAAGLGPVPARVLALLEANPDRVVSYSEIAAAAAGPERWRGRGARRSTIRWQISRVREWLESGATPLRIRVVPGVGYRLDVISVG